MRHRSSDPGGLLYAFMGSGNNDGGAGSVSTNVTHRFNIVPIRIQKKSRVVRVMVPTIPGLPVVCTARVQSCLMEFMHIVDGLGLERQMKICQRFSPFGDVELIEVETRLITAETIVLTLGDDGVPTTIPDATVLPITAAAT